MTTILAPGRVNLIGEHTDHAGGLSMPAAIDRTIALEIVRTSDRIELRSAGREPAVVPADGSGAASGWARFPAAVAMELAAMGRAPVGIEGTITSDLPEGAGLASSAALAVAIAIALCDVAGSWLEPGELAAACSRAEGRAVGVRCGVMDHVASLLGRKDHVVLLDAGSLEVDHLPLPPDVRFLILHSGLSRRLEHSGYGLRVEQLRRALAGSDDPVDRRRARHLETENRRVLAVADALRAEPPALDEVGGAMIASHESLREDFEVSTPELDALVELAVQHGAIGARLTGAGFGGAVVALVDATDAERIGSAAIAAYRDAFPGPASSYLVCRAADGARHR